jgi:hypothetical protein
MQIQSQTQPDGRERPSDEDEASLSGAHHALPSAVVAIGSRHGFGAEATRALWDSLVTGNGAMAQFSHAEFGGHGQWMRGGMLMIGDMFNRQLAARVSALCDDLAIWLAEHPATLASAGAAARARGSEWWPAGLHSPSTSGAQNGVRYAYFSDQRRLAIERGGKVELYDTDDHLIGGVSQQQGGSDSLAFTSQRGDVELSKLHRVHEAGTAAMVCGNVATPTEQPGLASESGPYQSHNVLEMIEKLAALHERGVLTDAEFAAKKTELLGRL